jgi:polysaccharide biosynthesis transport protein
VPPWLGRQTAMADSLVPAESQSSPTSRSSGGFAGDSYGAPEPPKQSLERPLAAIRRYKWLMVAVVALATIAGVVGSNFITPMYEVRATVWIESKVAIDRNSGPIQSAQLLQSNAWTELLKSFRIVDAVVRKQVLYVIPSNPEEASLYKTFAVADRFLPGRYKIDIDKSKKTWALTSAAGVAVGRGAAADSVGTQVGFKWVLPPEVFAGSGQRTLVFGVATPREKSSDVIRRLDTRLQPLSNFLWLTYRDADPQRAARTLNTWLKEFTQVAAELKKTNVVEYSNILREQLTFAEKATQDAERAYQNFRVNTITLPTEGGPVPAGIEAGAGTRDPAVQDYFDKKIQYENLKQDRQALELALANDTAPSAGMLLIPSVATGPGATTLREAFAQQFSTQARLRTERQTYTDEYVTVKELKNTLDILQTQTIPQLARQLLAQLKERELDYERRIQGASRELQQIPPRTIEETRLKRAVTVAEGLYTSLKSSYAQAQLAEASATPDVSVLDTAIAPAGPTSNTAPGFILMAIAGGIGAAIALALLLDQLDRRVRYAEQVSHELGLTIAGTVPRVPKGGISASSPEQVLQFIESFRSLRMHITHSIPGQKIVVAVTSAAPGDGKSLTSANLALSFAEAGVRTVLVDGDTRRGSLHKMFGLTAAGGLTDFLLGSIDAQAAVRQTTHENLSFVSCGRRHPRSPELLTSLALKRFVENLSQSFDVVLFDTPPLAAGIDGFAISAATGSVLMVLRLGQTERRLVASKLAVVDRLPVTILGAVLNGVPQSGEFKYYAYSAGYSIDAGDPAGELETQGAK